MSKLNDLTGKQFNYLVVLSRAASSKTGISRWLCRCTNFVNGSICNKEKIIFRNALTEGRTKSCGCYKKQVPRHKDASSKSFKDGLSQDLIGRRHADMLKRCFLPKNKQYKNYGGRGITVCERWLNRTNYVIDLVNLWNNKRLTEPHLPELPGSNYSVDRINNDGNYELGNVRWATDLEQASNKRLACNIVKLDFNGRTYYLSELAREFSIGITTLKYRLDAGWSIEDAIKIPRNYSNSKHKLKK